MLSILWPMLITHSNIKTKFNALQAKKKELKKIYGVQQQIVCISIMVVNNFLLKIVRSISSELQTNAGVFCSSWFIKVRSLKCLNVKHSGMSNVSAILGTSYAENETHTRKKHISSSSQLNGIHRQTSWKRETAKSRVIERMPRMTKWCWRLTNENKKTPTDSIFTNSNTPTKYCR